MWRPDPAWQQLAPARSSTAGVYLVPGSPARVVKRLLRPSEDDTPAHDPEHWTYWRREVEVAREEAFRTTPGLRAPAVEVHEDRAGATLVSPWVPDDRPSGEERAWALGRFAACAEPVAVWWSRPSLPDRLRSLEHGGGWRGLDATPLAGAAEVLWRRREELEERLGTLPRVLSHGDAVAANLRARVDGGLCAIDWSAVGLHPLGADLGIVLLSVREPLGPLLTAYRAGALDGRAAYGEREVAHGAAIMAAYTLLTRLAHAVGGPDEDAAVVEAMRFADMLEAVVEL